MSKETNIQWCDSSSNPVMGCDGCELWSNTRKTCYAGVLHERYGGSNSGFAPTFEQVTLFPGRMAKAAKWSDLRGKSRPGKPWLNGRPRMIFVSDMSDALSNDVPVDYLAREIVDVANSPEGRRHVWLWLTKRPSRLHDVGVESYPWPKNLWCGTSITSRSTVGRIESLRCFGLNMGAHTFLSVEPQIEFVDLENCLAGVDWIIQGGESGANPRPFALEWAREMRDVCERRGVPYFLKQLGANPDCPKLRDSHGGEWDEWPEDLRVRQVPMFETVMA